MDTTIATNVEVQNNGSNSNSQAPLAKLLRAGKDAHIVAMSEMAGYQPSLILGHGRVGLYSQDQIDDFTANGGQTIEVVRDQLFADLKQLEDEINSQMVGLSDMVHLSMLGLVTGDNVFFYSLPGDGKSTTVRLVAEGISGKFFRINMTPDLSKSDLLGPISVNGIQNGKWTREWQGLAGCHVAMVDEFFKGSPTSRANLLDIAEEHTVSDANGQRPVPIVTMYSASNELIDPSPRHAMWDRFMMRYELSYPNSPDEMQALFTASSGRKPITVRIDPSDIILLQGVVEYISMNLPKAIIKLLVKTLTALKQKNVDPSPRRRLGWARAVVAEALLTGSKNVVNDHLLVGRHILWIDPKDRKAVDDVVSGVSSPERAAMIRAKSDLEAIRNQMGGFKDASEAQTAVVKLSGLRNQLENFVLADEYADEKAELITKMQGLTVELTELSVKLIQASQNK